MKKIVNILNAKKVTTIPIRNVRYIKQFSDINIKNLVINKKNFYLITKFLKIIKNVEIIHTHHTFSSLITSFFYIIFLFKKDKKYFVHTVHRNFSSFSIFNRALYLIFIFPFRDKLIANSFTTKKSLEAFMPKYLHSNITVITNGVDLSFFENSNKKAKNLNKIKILSIGRMVKIKNQKILINTLKDLVDKKYDVTIDFCGDGQEFNSLVRLVKDYDIEKYVNFHGMVSEEKVYKLLDECNFSVITSFNEGFGVATIESMASGALTLGSNIDINKEIIKDEELLFNPYDHQQLSEKILKFFNNKKLYQLKVDFLLNSVEKYSSENTAKAHDLFYKNIY